MSIRGAENPSARKCPSQRRRRTASWNCSTIWPGRPKRSALRSPTPGARSPSTGPEAGRLEPAHDLLRTLGRSIDDLVADYAGKGYGDLKKDLATVVADFVRPVQERSKAYLDDPAQLDKLLGLGAEKARSVASITLRKVHDRIGFLAPARNE